MEVRHAVYFDRYPIESSFRSSILRSTTHHGSNQYPHPATTIGTTRATPPPFPPLPPSSWAPASPLLSLPAFPPTPKLRFSSPITRTVPSAKYLLTKPLSPLDAIAQWTISTTVPCTFWTPRATQLGTCVHLLEHLHCPTRSYSWAETYAITAASSGRLNTCHCRER